MVTLAPAATAPALDGDATAVARLQGEPQRHRQRLELGHCRRRTEEGSTAPLVTPGAEAPAEIRRRLLRATLCTRPAVRLRRSVTPAGCFPCFPWFSRSPRARNATGGSR